MNTEQLRARVYHDSAKSLNKAERMVFNALAQMPGVQAALDAEAALRGWAKKSAEERVRLDAQTLVLAARQVEHVMQGLYEEPTPEWPMANGDIVKIDTSVPLGAATFTWYGVSGRGIAEFCTHMAAGSAPTVSLRGFSKTQPVHPLLLGYAHTIHDVRTAAFSGFPLDEQEAKAARNGHARKQHLVGLWGREDLKIPGLIKHPGITVLDAPADGTASSRYWENKSSDLKLRDIDLLVNNLAETSFGLRKTNRVLVPRRAYHHLAGTFATSGQTLTLLNHIKSIYEGVEWKILDDLAASKSAGNLSADAAFAYFNNPDIVYLNVPLPFMTHAPQQEALTIKTWTESQTGGITLKEPPICCRMDSIGST